jgi:hypothetical protein
MLIRAACVFCLGLLLSAAAGAVQAETIYISFDDLDSLARTESPGSRIIENEYKKTLAERDAQLQWSNPEVAYDREDVDVSEEYQVVPSFCGRHRLSIT